MAEFELFQPEIAKNYGSVGVEGGLEGTVHMYIHTWMESFDLCTLTSMHPTVQWSLSRNDILNKEHTL